MSDGQTVRVVIDGTEVLATVNVERSRHFRRDGFDVHSDVTISFTLVAGCYYGGLSFGLFICSQY